MDRRRSSCQPDCRKSSPQGFAATKLGGERNEKTDFASLLCVIMLFGMLPITALAAEPKTIYVDATEGNDKIMVPKTSLMRQLKRL